MSSKSKSRCDCGQCEKPEDNCCDAPYRYCNCNKIALNVVPSKCIIVNPIYKELYCKLYNAILDYNLEIALNNMYIQTAPNDSAADLAYTNFYTLVTSVLGMSSCSSNSTRLVITEQDGTVVLDTFFTSGNTRAAWRAKTINENHNTRLAIMTAQMFKEGTGYETKLSTTTSTVQMYVAIRAGKFTNSYGTFRLSVDMCT
jgi:hypothetical protein